MKLMGSVALHLFLVPDGPRLRVDVKPLIHVDTSEHLRVVANALREIAQQLDEQASPILVPPGVGAH